MPGLPVQGSFVGIFDFASLVTCLKCDLCGSRGSFNVTTHSYEPFQLHVGHSMDELTRVYTISIVHMVVIMNCKNQSQHNPNHLA